MVAPINLAAGASILNQLLTNCKPIWTRRISLIRRVFCFIELTHEEI